MSSIFSVGPDEINRLNQYQLTELLIKLISLEAGKNGIPKSNISGTLNITVADGGEDARIEWSDGPEKTEWLKSRCVLFQCKDTDTSRENCRKEVLKTDNITVKERVDDVLSRGGSYILFCTTSCTGKMESERISGFRDGFSDANKPYASTADIYIYDANKISNWVNEYVSAIALVKNFIGPIIPDGLKTWDEWSGYINDVTDFVSDDILNKYIIEIRKHFLNNGKVARIVGLSGIGKSRLALEIFRPPKDISDGIEQYSLSSSCVYIKEAKDELPDILGQFVRHNLSSTIIVDDCDYNIHKKLRKEVEHRDSKLKLLTLDFNTIDIDDDIPVINLKKVSDDIIKGILKQVYPGLSDGDTFRIVEFSQGFPQIAVLLGKARTLGVENIGQLKDRDLIKRLVWQRESPNDEGYTVIKTCSLFDKVGYFEEVASERILIANNIASINPDVFYKHAEDFIKRGVIDRRGRFIRVVPPPLAITLAAEWWGDCSPEKLKEVFNDLTPELVKALSEQISKLHFVPKAKEFVKTLVGSQAPFGQAEVLLTEQGSRLFRSFVEVNPESCTEAIENVFGKLTKEELLAVGPARRNLIWSLEKLCFWKETFYSAASILLSFAAAENETWANNATNQFLQLFHIYLSGTQASPEDRFSIINEALTSDWIEKRILAVKALGSVLHSYHFSRSGGVETQGSRAALRDWEPKDFNEIISYQKKAIEKLTEIACTDSELLEYVKHELGIRIRELVHYDQIDNLDFAIDRIISTVGNYWPEALHSIRQTLELDRNSLSEEMIKILEKMVNKLIPNDVPEKLRLIVSIPDWEHHKDDNDHYIDVSAQRAKILATELNEKQEELANNIEIIFSGEQRQGFTFGYALGQLHKNPKSFIELALNSLRIIPEDRANPNVLCGFLAAISDRNIIGNTLEEVSKDSKLTKFLIELTRFSKFNLLDVKRILELVDQGLIKISELSMFSYNSVTGHLSIEEITSISDLISTYGSEGSVCAFNILYMYCFHDNERLKKCLPNFKTYLSRKGFLIDIEKPNYRAGHAWEQIIEYLLKNDDNEIVPITAEDIIKLSYQENIPYNANYYISRVLKMLIKDYFDVVWPIIGRSLIEDDIVQRYHLMHMFGNLYKKEKPQEHALSYAPSDLLIKWCKETQPNGARIIASFFPVVEVDESGSFKWNKIMRLLIDNFGNDESFLKAISGNLNSFIWSGSLIPYYNNQISLMNELSDHPFINTRKWAKDNIHWLKKTIEDIKKHEEEHILGIF